MKLSDIEKINSVAMNNKMREKIGWNLNLQAMTVNSAHSMIESIDKKLSNVRSSHKLHESQQNPSYVGLLMAKQTLEKFVAEAKLKVSDKKVKNKTEVKVDETKKKVNEKALSVKQQQAAGAALAAKRGDAPKSKLKGASKEMMGMSTKELEKIAGTKHKGLPKKKVSESRLFEDELGQAQAMLAAKDMVDSMQDMIEDLSRMMNEQLPPLTDSIRTAIGSAEADAFKASASSTLSALLTTVQSSRESMDQAVRTLSGEPGALTVPDSMTGMGTDSEEMDFSDEVDDFTASDAAAGGDLPLGREKR